MEAGHFEIRYQHAQILVRILFLVSSDCRERKQSLSCPVSSYKGTNPVRAPPSWPRYFPKVSTHEFVRGYKHSVYSTWKVKLLYSYYKRKCIVCEESSCKKQTCLCARIFFTRSAYLSPSHCDGWLLISHTWHLFQTLPWLTGVASFHHRVMMSWETKLLSLKSGQLCYVNCAPELSPVDKAKTSIYLTAQI